MADKTREHGLVHVYLGSGKGKTTAALGIAMRSIGHGQSVLLIQFFKDRKDTGETRIARRLAPQLEVHHFTHPDPIDFTDPSMQHMFLAREGLTFAEKRVRELSPSVLILDEINPVVHADIIHADELIRFLNARPKHLEVVLTGDPAHSSLLNVADLVTEMEPIKQVWNRRAGIER